MKIETVKCGSLVRDWALWPREKGKTRDLDRQNVNVLKRAYERGEPIPPIIADTKTRIIVDGFHRWTAKVEMTDNDPKHAEIEVEWRDYPDKSAILHAATVINRTHGMRLTEQDLSYTLILAYKFKWTSTQMEQAMGKEAGTLAKFFNGRTVTLQSGEKRAIPAGVKKLATLKRPVTEAERQAIESSNAMPPQTNMFMLLKQLRAPACCRFTPEFLAGLEELGCVIESTLLREGWKKKKKQA